MDCLGFLNWVGIQHGILERKHWYYTRNPDPRVFVAGLSEHLIRKPKSAIEVGDVLYFKDRYWCHVGIVTDYRHGGFGVIHAKPGESGVKGLRVLGSVVEHHLDAEWYRRAVMAFEIPGIVRD